MTSVLFRVLSWLRHTAYQNLGGRNHDRGRLPSSDNEATMRVLNSLNDISITNKLLLAVTLVAILVLSLIHI